MLLENTGVGVIGFGLKKKGSKPVLAIPGVNRIDDKNWKELEKNPSIVNMVKKGRLKIIIEVFDGKNKKKDAVELPPGVIAHPDFLDIEDDEVVLIVKKCLFLPLINDWLDGETRPKVVRALHEQKDICGPTEVQK